MTRKENVKRTIKFENPEYIPLMYGPDYFYKSDVVGIKTVELFGGHNGFISEWGFEWHEDNRGFYLGQIKTPAINDWAELSGYDAFDVNRNGRFDNAKRIMSEYPDRYYIADFGLSGFTTMAFIRGFENFMIDLYEEPQYVEKLADYVINKEMELIKECALNNFDAIGLIDDYGGQQSLLISHDMFVKFFKHRLKCQVEYAHSLGLDVYMHSCGKITDIITDLIEIGIDIVNPGQPSLNGIEYMGKTWGGKVCFACPVSYQTTGISGTPAQVEQEICDYLQYMSKSSGGFIGMILDDLESLGSTAQLEAKILRTWEKNCGLIN